MVVDLTKRTPLEPEPSAVAEEPVALTAREELMVPLRAFAAAVAAGSPVAGIWIIKTVWQGVRAASKPHRTGGRTADGKEATLDAEGGIGDLIEQLVLGVFVVVGACTLAGGAVGVLWTYAAPYAGWVILALVAGWCLLAAAFAPEPEAEEGEATTEGDHEQAAGEEREESAEEGESEEDEEGQEARWQEERNKLRQFVEQRVAAGASGHTENVKGRGARVDDLLAEQQQRGALPGMQRKGMIEHLEMAGITVREQMSFRVYEETSTGWKWVKKNVPGVHVEDLTEDLGRIPRLPAHLVPDLTPGAPSILSQETDPESDPIPAAQAAGE
ncbi:hypothetical protein [Streptomyces eurythermus]